MTFAVPRLHLIGPLGGLDAGEYAAIAACVASRVGGCAVHLRLPGHPGGEILAAALPLKRALETTTATLIINDRLDVAQITGNHAVHLGERSFSVANARKLLGDEALIGRSIHDMEGAQAATGDGADYLIAGHIFETPSKAGMPPRGLSWLAEICAAIPIPVIAIGGITPDRIPAIVEAGAHGVAIGRALLEADQPAEEAARMYQRIHRVGDENVQQTEQQTIRVQLNGAEVTTATGTTVQRLLKERDIEHRMIAIEYNAEILPRHAYESTVLQEDDRLEIVQMVGGG